MNLYDPLAVILGTVGAVMIFKFFLLFTTEEKARINTAKMFLNHGKVRRSFFEIMTAILLYLISIVLWYHSKHLAGIILVIAPLLVIHGFYTLTVTIKSKKIEEEI